MVFSLEVLSLFATLWSGIKPECPALAGRCLTTGLPASKVRWMEFMLRPWRLQSRLEDRFADTSLQPGVHVPQGRCRQGSGAAQREGLTLQGGVSIRAFNYRADRLMPSYTLKWCSILVILYSPNTGQI